MEFIKAKDTQWLLELGNQFLYRLGAEAHWQERAALMQKLDKSRFNKEAVHKLLATLRKGENFCGSNLGIAEYPAKSVANITGLFINEFIADPLFQDFPPKKAQVYYYQENGKKMFSPVRELLSCEQKFLRSHVLMVLRYRYDKLREIRRPEGDFQCDFYAEFVGVCEKIRREHCGNGHADSSIYEERAKAAGFSDVILYRIVDGLLQRIITG